MIPREQCVPLIGVLALAFAVLITPFPGSLSVVVTASLTSVWTSVSGIEWLSEVMLVVCALAAAGTGIAAWRRDGDRRARLVAASAGVVLAYALSEAGKVVFAQERPCARWVLPGECPPAGDWSLPSNHATLAFGAVVVIAFAARRAWVTWVAIGAAILVATGRVMQGAHYLHDVALGALLGTAVPALSAIVVHVWTMRRRTRR